MRTVVVGAGIVGAAIAYRLSRAGQAVTVVEATRPAAGTSSRSFAWANANHKPPRPYHDLNAAGLVEHHQLSLGLPGDWWHPTGNLVVAASAAEAVVLRQDVERLRAWNYRAEEIDRAWAHDLLPAARLPSDNTAAFAFFPDEGWVTTASLIERLLTGARAAGAEVLIGEPAMSLVVTGGRVAGVATTAGEHAADLVIDCTGPAAGRLLEPLGLAVARQRSPGLLVVTEPVAVRFERVLHMPEVHVRPDGGGRLLVGATGGTPALDDLPDTTHWLPPDSPLPVALLRRAAEVIPALASCRVEAARVGWRPLPGDGLSAIGPVPGLDGYYLAFTHSGVTLGPVLGRLVAEEVTTGQIPPLLASFRPDRLVSGA